MASKQEGTRNQASAAADETSRWSWASPKVMGIVGAVILIAGAVFYYMRESNKQQNVQANMELSHIRGAYDRGDFASAISGDTAVRVGGQKPRGLQQIADDYSGTAAGKVAALYLGTSLVATGHPDKAGKYYTIATTSDDETTSAAGHAGLACVAEYAGKYDEAAQEYVAAANADKMELNAPDYLLDAARNYERAKKKDEAVKQYRRVATQFSESQASADARVALANYNIEL